MENMQAKLKKLINLGQKAFAVEFRGEQYFVVENGKLNSGDVIGKDYHLFNAAGHLIGLLNFVEVHMSEEERELERFSGAAEVPKSCFMLVGIEIMWEYRGKHLGDFLINWGLKDIQKDIAKTGEHKPILFVRENNHVTIPFYKKWGAELNQKVENNRCGSSCYMIIKEPKHKEEYCGKIIGEYEKINTKGGK